MQFQDVIIRAAGSEALELGLLMTEELDVNSEEDEEYYSFQHKLIHEYVAACYVAKQVETNPTFLRDVFTTYEVIFQYIEVVGFCTHVLKSYANAQHMKLFVEHITERFSDKVFEQIENDSTAIQSDFRDRYSEVLSVMLPAFGDGDSERECNFAQMCKGFIHTASAPYRPPYLLYAAKHIQNSKSSNERVLIAYRSDWSDLIAALSLYTGITHLYLSEIGQATNEYDDLFFDDEDDNFNNKKLFIPIRDTDIHDLTQVVEKHSIEGVRLFDSNLSDSDFIDLGKIITTSVPELPLRYLAICRTQLRKFSEHLVSSMNDRTLSRLTYLDLGECGIPDSVVFELINSLNQCPDLEYVNLDGNAVIGTKLKVLQSECISRPLVSELIYRLIHSSQDSNKHHLVAALKKQVTIAELDLYNCQIPISGLIDIVAQLHHCTNLMRVNLNGNGLPEIDLAFSLSEGESRGEVIQAELLTRIKQVTEFTLVISNKTAKADIDVLAVYCQQLKCLKLKTLRSEEAGFQVEVESDNLKHLAEVKENGCFPQLESVKITTLKFSACILAPLPSEVYGRFETKQMSELLVTSPSAAASIAALVMYCPQMKKIELKQDTITDGNSSNVELVAENIKCIADVIQAKSFPQLQDIDYSSLSLPFNILSPLLTVLPSSLTGFCLDVNKETVNAEIDNLAKYCPQLGKLVLNQGSTSNEELVVENVNHIADAIRAGNFPQLQNVDISSLRVSLSTLLPLLPVLPTPLIELSLYVDRPTEKADIDSLAKYCPHLKKLKLVLEPLNFLGQCDEELVAENVKHIAYVVQAGSFPQLENIDYNSLKVPLSNLGPLLSVLPTPLTEFSLYVERKTVKDEIDTLAKYCPHLKELKLKQEDDGDVSNEELVTENIKHIADVIHAGIFLQLKDVGIRHLTVSSSTLLPLRLVLPPPLTEFTLFVDSETVKADIDTLAKYCPQLKQLELLQQLKQLELLQEYGGDSSKKELTAKNIQHIVDAIKKRSFPQLQDIRMQGIKAPPGGLASLLSASAACSGLLSLDIEFCNLSQSLHHLTQHPLPSLLHLRLEGCSLTKQDIQSLSECITGNQCPRLRVINLWFNELGDEDVTPLCEALLQFKGPTAPGKQQGELENFLIKRKQLMERDVISVALCFNVISREFRKQWEGKHAENKSVCVKWGWVDWWEDW